MRGRASCVAAIVTTLLLCAGPAMALETKPTTPPTPIEASPASPYIESVRYVGGNGDFVPDPGERLQVFFTLRNTTDKALSGVTGTLVIPKDASVTVVDGIASWPDIAPGALEESSTPFVIQIADGAKRSEPCAGGPIALPAPGSDMPVSSDGGTVSSDGIVTSDGNTGSGSAGSSGAPTSVPGSEPGSTGTVSPEPSLVAPAPEANAPVPFDAAVAVHTSTGSFDTDFVSGLACPLALGAPGTKSGAGEVAPVADVAAAAKSATPSSAPFVIGVLVVATGALVARYRFTL